MIISLCPDYRVHNHLIVPSNNLILLKHLHPLGYLCQTAPRESVDGSLNHIITQWVMLERTLQIICNGQGCHL